VIPEVEGDPAEGYEVGVRSAEPSTVEIVGPHSAVDAVTAAITEPVSVAGESKSIVKMVSVGVADPTVRLKNVHVVRVTVTIRPVGTR
jgi:YbbR domain-containing protein